MEFTPRYPQPFTIQEASALDVAVIIEEITRLQNSLVHLRQTQQILRDSIAQDPDPELTKAFDENQGVIGSQEERIRMLKFILSDKGVHFNEHYDLATTEQEPPPQQQQRPSTEIRNATTTGLEDDDTGLHL